MFMNTYTETLRQEIEAALDSATQFHADCPDRLREAMRYSLLTPGKRLRPTLVLAACELCDQRTSERNPRSLTFAARCAAMPAACAVEMIHAYSLIHDDLPAMDNDDLRRGQPTCHRKFDEATAILAGDALLTLAFEMVGTLTPPELAGRCCKELAVAAGACRLIGGQMDDMFREHFSRDSMEHVHHRKTGALICVSLKLGGIIAGASESQLTALDEFGKHFGLAFQITDDLLDVLGDEVTVGKRLNKDADMNKWSYPLLLGIEEAKQAAEKAVDDAEKALTIFKEESLPLQLLRDSVKRLPNRVK
jgi:geranylgeranyl diphosphate synthase type II